MKIDNLKPAKLLAIGEALIDFAPDKKDCAFGEVTAFSPKVGGAPANVCAAFAKLGGKAALLSQLGNDPFGHKIIDELKEAGVETDYITLTEKANTALAFVSLSGNGDRTFSFYRKPSADMLYSPENICDEYFNDAFALHFCSVSLGDFPMKEAHKTAIEKMRKAGGIVSFDPNLRFQLWDSADMLIKTVREFIPYADILKISDEELSFITGESDIKKALSKLFKGSVKLVIYTCGSGGAYAFTEKASAFSAGHKVKAVDTTGAGDGFIGSFLWKLMKLEKGVDDLKALTEKELKKCLDFSNAFCAKSVQRSGAITSYPSADEI